MCQFGNLLDVYPCNFRCRFCIRERTSVGSVVVDGKRCCARCLAFFRVGANPDAKPPPGRVAGEDEPKRAPKTVKWWDAKAREWRWVSPKSKPKLTPYARE